MFELYALLKQVNVMKFGFDKQPFDGACYSYLKVANVAITLWYHNSNISRYLIKETDLCWYILGLPYAFKYIRLKNIFSIN